MSVDLLPQAAGSASIGRYEVLGRLATGGMAEVYLACLRGPSAFERAVVVKRILPHLAELAEFTAMFLDEARIAASIRHPNVVQVHELSRDDDGLYLVMEYLHGETLSSLERRVALRGERLEPALAAWVLAEVCAGLHAAHELRDPSGRPKELVHRDVSPDNLFVTYDGSVKVVDFGIAKAADRVTKTETGQIKGKFHYMSPEQCNAEAIDRRSDVFSAGIVLFEMLTGHRLFKRDTRMASWMAVTSEPIPSAASFVPDLPPALDRVLARALSRDRERRHPTALELRKDLLAFVRSVPGYELPDERLRELMQHHFADRIAEKNELLRRMERGAPVGPLPRSQTDEHVELPSVAAHRSQAATVVDAQPSSRAERRVSPLLAVLVLLLLVGVGGGIGLAIGGRVRSEEAASDTSRELVETTSTTERVAQPTTITLTVETEPPGATILLDDVERGLSPLAIAMPPASVPVAIVARADGFEDATSRVVPDVSVLVRLALVPAAPRPPEPTEPTERASRPRDRSRRSTARTAPTRPAFERFD